MRGTTTASWRSANIRHRVFIIDVKLGKNESELNEERPNLLVKHVKARMSVLSESEKREKCTKFNGKAVECQHKTSSQ